MTAKLCFKKPITVFCQYNAVLLRGCCEPAGTKLWRFSLLPQDHPCIPTKYKAGPVAINTHDLPSIGALIRYLHAASGFQVKSTWISAIKLGNFTSWTGLTSTNASKYSPVYVESLQVHQTQARKFVCFTKSKYPIDLMLPDIATQLPAVKSQEIFIQINPISKIFIYDIPTSKLSPAEAITTSFYPLT